MRDSCSKMPFPNFPFQVFAKLIAAAMQARPGGLRVDAVRPFSCLESIRIFFKPRISVRLSLFFCGIV